MSGTEIDIGWVQDIANRTRGEIAADAAASTATFKSTTVDAAAVGNLAISQQYAAQVRAAHTFFAETVQGVLDDLQVFGDNLHACASAHSDNDDNAAAALQAFDTTYTDHVYQSAPEQQASAEAAALDVGSSESGEVAPPSEAQVAEYAHGAAPSGGADSGEQGSGFSGGQDTPPAGPRP